MVKSWIETFFQPSRLKMKSQFHAFVVVFLSPVFADLTALLYASESRDLSTDFEILDVHETQSFIFIRGANFFRIYDHDLRELRTISSNSTTSSRAEFYTLDLTLSRFNVTILCELHRKCFAFDANTNDVFIDPESEGILRRARSVNFRSMYRGYNVIQFLAGGRRYLDFRIENASLSVLSREELDMARGRLLSTFQLDDDTAYASFYDDVHEIHTMTCMQLSIERITAFRITCGVNNIIHSVVMVDNLLVLVYNDNQGVFQICTLRAAVFGSGCQNGYGTKEGRTLVSIAGSPIKVTTANKYLIVSTADCILQLVPRKLHHVAKVESPDHIVSVNGRNSKELIVIYSRKLSFLIYSDDDDLSPTVSILEPGVLQVGACTEITYFEDEILPHGYTSTVYIDDIECIPQSSEDNVSVCKLTRPLDHVFDNKFIVKLLSLEGMSSEVIFYDVVLANIISVLNVYTHDIGEMEMYVDVYGENLHGGMAQTLIFQKNCSLMEDSSRYLRFRCAKPLCETKNRNQLYQPHLLIGEWQMKLNLSNEVCISVKTVTNLAFLAYLCPASVLVLIFILASLSRIRHKFSLSASEDVIAPDLRKLVDIELERGINVYEPQALSMNKPLKQSFYGTIYHGVLNSKEGPAVAVSLKKLASNQDAHRLRTEASIMLRVNHPQVVQCIGLCEVNKTPDLLIMPFFKNGDLHSLVRLNNIDANLAVNILSDVAKGMSHLASQGVVHRDLAARNILLTDNFEARIGDFGHASYTNHDGTSQLKNVKAPVRWLAVECFTDMTYTVASDIWSFGILCWEVFSRGALPYPGVGDDDVIEHIQSDNKNSKPVDAPDWIFSVMMKCWNSQPRTRPHFSMLLDLLQEQRQAKVDRQSVLSNLYETIDEIDYVLPGQDVYYSNMATAKYTDNETNI